MSGSTAAWVETVSTNVLGTALATREAVQASHWFSVDVPRHEGARRTGLLRHGVRLTDGLYSLLWCRAWRSGSTGATSSTSAVPRRAVACMLPPSRLCVPWRKSSGGRQQVTTAAS